MKRLVGILYICLFSNLSYTREYLYPVAHTERDQEHFVYLIHQVSLKHLELLEWHMPSKVITKVLASAVTPSGIKILPDHSGYSFIDQDQLYIKYFSKRSARKIDIHEPLYSIEMLEWIDANTCYFSAKNNEKRSIYQLSLSSGMLRVLAQASEGDCLYPQQIDSKVFYIERSFNKKKHTIKSISCQESCTILEMNEEPIAFLRMMSPTSGFFVSFSHSIDTQSTCVSFAYHHIEYDPIAHCWSRAQLFDFSIPLDLLMPQGKCRLYESLLPLLPYHTAAGIYYCDCKPHNKDQASGHRNCGGWWYEAPPVKMYVYDPTTKKITLQSHEAFSCDIFAPIMIKNNLFFGYSLEGNSKNKPLLPGMWRAESGQLCFNLPHINDSPLEKNQ